MTDHKHINVRLEGPALATAQDIHAAVARFNELQEALQEEYQKRLQDLQDETQKELKALWPQLHLAAGVPVGEVGEWKLDASYLEDHGVAFLSKCCDEESEGFDLAAMLQAAASSGLKH
ncbi:hypothetical protein LK3_58 [Bordetella phage LK3]|uniref:Uncharacterized protein n=1 Tax=Bordetella phage LK3 TaxID=1926943 RepID=A0A2D0W8V7_9CAUD|nr:hypothetical protein LK3_58 [Bordetella phage LK3]